MHARLILAALALVFIAAAALRWVRHGRQHGRHCARHPGRRIDPATRTWLLIALVFATVAAWLQWHTS